MKQIPGVGARLKSLRKDAALSMAQLAQASGVSKTQINRIELGMADMTRVTVVAKLARGLGVDFETLAGMPQEDTRKVQEIRAENVSLRAENERLKAALRAMLKA